MLPPVASSKKPYGNLLKAVLSGIPKHGRQREATGGNTCFCFPCGLPQWEATVGGHSGNTKNQESKVKESRVKRVKSQRVKESKVREPRVKESKVKESIVKSQRVNESIKAR